MSFPREYEVDPANVPSSTILRYKALFIFLQVFGGQIGMPLFVGTMLVAPSVKRHLTLVNFCASWTVYSIVYCLTIYHDVDRFEGVGSRLCVAQAAMVHGVVPLSAVAYCALHIQVWMGVQGALSQTSWLQKQKKTILISLFFAPYAVFIAFFVGSLIICLKHPELVERTGQYYCTINYDPLVYAVPGFSAGVVVIMLILEIIIGVTLVRRWKAVRSSQRLNAASISMIVRIAIFSVYGFATLAACAAFLARSLSIWPYLVQASLPTAVFLMFGTRRDVWRAWYPKSWRLRSRSRHCPSSSSSSSSSRVGTTTTSAMSIRIDIEKSVTSASDDDSERLGRARTRPRPSLSLDEDKKEVTPEPEVIVSEKVPDEVFDMEKVIVIGRPEWSDVP